jgi:hypothetical protein
MTMCLNTSFVQKEKILRREREGEIERERESERGGGEIEGVTGSLVLNCIN